MSKCARCGAGFVTTPESQSQTGLLCKYCQITELKEENQHIREWYSSRLERLSQFIREEIPEPQKTRYFSIIANGAADHMESNTYECQLIKRNRRIEALEKACAEMRDILSDLAGRMQGHSWGQCGTYSISNAQLYGDDLNRINKALGLV